MKTSMIIYIAILIVPLSASAKIDSFDQRSEKEISQSQKSAAREREQRRNAENESISLRLEEINGTSVSFYPNVRNYNPGGEDVRLGEWRLGNGGVCVRALWTGNVICKNASGYNDPALRAD